MLRFPLQIPLSAIYLQLARRDFRGGNNSQCAKNINVEARGCFSGLERGAANGERQNCVFMSLTIKIAASYLLWIRRSRICALTAAEMGGEKIVATTRSVE